MSAGGRFEVQRALAVGPHTQQFDETIAAERAEAHGLVPPELLGVQAHLVGRAASALPAGTGLTVRLNPAITLDTAQTYANALLTAGVTDADVGVAAPTSQQAWGTTALLGLLRAARAACLTIDPARHDLAIREVVLTGELARQIGREAAPALLFALKSRPRGSALGRRAALAALVTRDVRGRRASPCRRRTARPLVAFLHDLVANGAYARVAAAHPTLSDGGAAAVDGAARRPYTHRRRYTARRPHSRRRRAGAWRGVVTAAGSRDLTARLAGGARTYALAPGAQVYRNGQFSSPAALRPGDAITITTNAAGLATLVQASRPAQCSSASAPATRAQRRLDRPAGLLVLLALLLTPFLVGWLRRRQAHAAGMATPPGGLFSFLPRNRRRGP